MGVYNSAIEQLEEICSTNDMILNSDFADSLRYNSDFMRLYRTIWVTNQQLRNTVNMLRTLFKTIDN